MPHSATLGAPALADTGYDAPVTHPGADPGPPSAAARLASTASDAVSLGASTGALSLGVSGGASLRGLRRPGAALAGADLRGVDLAGSDLQGADLQGADLSGAALHGARLRGALLTGARLVGIQAHDLDLEGAALQRADLTGADLTGAILLETELSDACLAGARLERADLRQARLGGADLSGADLRGADLVGARLPGARLDEVRWERAHLREVIGLDPELRAHALAQGAWDGVIAPELVPLARLAGRALRPGLGWARARTARLRATAVRALTDTLEARSARREAEREAARQARLRRLPGGPGEDLSGQDLRQGRLDGVDWRGARLVGTLLDRAWLRRSDLSGAELRQAQLSGAHLAEARLTDVRAQGARLVDADLRDCDLRGADLSGADLTGADLRGAELEGANLADADLTAANLSDLLLGRVCLDRAILEQAELAGADLRQASVLDADLRGALGLEAAQRQALDEAGAQVDELGLTERLGRLDSRELVAVLGEAGRTLRPVLRWSRGRLVRLRTAAAGWAASVQAAAARARPVRRARHETPADRPTKPLPPVQAPTPTVGGPGADLSGQDLRGQHLDDADWRGALLVGTRLDSAWLRRALLAQADLRGAELSRARLDRADLRKVQATGVDLVDADLRGCDLRGAVLADADLTGADLRGADLDGADLGGADLTAARLSGLDLSGVRLDGAILDQADLVGSSLVAASVKGADLRGVLGLSALQRKSLEQAGAITDELSLVDRLAQIDSQDIAAVAAEAGRTVAPGLDWAQGRLNRLRDSVSTLVQERREERQASQERRALAEATPVRPSTPARPERLDTDEVGHDLHGQRLDDADWPGAPLARARLDGASLRRANLSSADLTAASLRRTRLGDADLRGIAAPGAQLIDADLRGCALGGADLRGADLTGADMRGAELEGADLSGADLTAARLSDLALAGVRLDRAVLDQADLAGSDLDGASVFQADLRGALGLSPTQRRALAVAGARTADATLEELARQVRPRHVAATLAVLALGLGSYSAARLLGPGPPVDPAALAQEILSLPPTQAMARFEDLAGSATDADDRISYLLEAAGQARRAELPADEERLLQAALTAAGEDLDRSAEARMALATLLATQDRATEALALVDPLLDQARQANEERARAVLLYLDLCQASGADPAPRMDALWASLGELPDAAADLHLALATAVANGGAWDRALTELEATDGLAVSDATRSRLLEARARILDRSGRVEEAGDAWETLINTVPPDTVPHLAARLALSDLRQRQGRTPQALALLGPLLEEDVDTRIRSRAWFVRARIHEDAGERRQAALAYRSSAELATDDPDTAEEARQALARIVGEGKGIEGMEDILAGLDPTARALVQVQARLGEARGLLDQGRIADAQAIYEEVAGRADAEESARREARTGLGEALAQEGDVARALVVWRDLLSETARPEDRLYLELRIAQGELRGGNLDEAAEAYADLAAAQSPDVSVQGRLGLAEVALARGEWEKARQLLGSVTDQATDPAWRVQALEELADMASQDGDIDATLAGWRAVLGAAPPGHPAAGRARLALATTLATAGRLDEARARCAEAVSGAANPGERLGARLACAELDERAGVLPSAYEAYAEVLAQDGPASAADFRSDAAAGAARTALALDRPAQALSAATQGLALATDIGGRLMLTNLQVDALRALGRDGDLAEAKGRRDALLADVPGAATGLLLDAAHQAEEAGRADEARQLLEQARDAATDPVQKAEVLLELADLQVEAGELEGADQAYAAAAAAALDDLRLQAQAGMGRAEVLRRGGDAAGAARLLGTLRAEDVPTRRALAEARARALSQAQDPAAAEAWRGLAELAGEDDEVRAAALRGQADALFAQDRPAEALPLYQQAGAATHDAALASWAALGAANARVALGQPGAAQALDALRQDPDPEVAVQAAVLRSQLAAAQEDWTAAAAALDGVEGAPLGAAWDATVVQARVAALLGAGARDAAEAALTALAERWPEDEEALVPALLGRAAIAQATGRTEDARQLAQQALDRARDPGFQTQARGFLAQLDAG